MLTIGAPLRKWTAFLLLCSIPTSAPVHTTNETTQPESGATAFSDTTTRHASTAAPQSLPFTHSFPHSFTDQDTLCPFRTINYITHTLPQQCLRTSWSTPGRADANGTIANSTTTPNLDSPIAGVVEEVKSSISEEKSRTTATAASQAEETGSTGSTPSSSAELEVELETDSPFDNANFLSFDEWKKRNLARAGQSPENVGQGRAAPSDEGLRRRPVNVNALDSLGDDAEIEIDFSGFGATAEGGDVQSNVRSDTQGAGATKVTEEQSKVVPSAWALSKDAGKTCKERFNYASFDCAATVLKTNKKAKSATSVLVESKDRYMLNECSAKNKFIIVELCDDILVDTVVLANYEFFSSMFRHFRVSVSDRYPVKMDRWRTLATFEARNSRDIQPFLVTESQIWARYLRIEFLTQFGNEFYCPLSLLRVHGTTMMDQFRREEEEARGLDDEVELSEIAEEDYVKPAENSGPLPADQVSMVLEKEASPVPEIIVSAVASEAVASGNIPHGSPQTKSQPRTSEAVSVHTTAATPPSQSTGAHRSESSPDASPNLSPPSTTPSSNNWEATKSVQNSKQTAAAPSKEEANASLSQTHDTISDASKITPVSIASQNHNAASPIINGTLAASMSSASVKASSNGTVASPQAQSQPRASSTQPSPAAPTTQESFFKSIHKRLLYLEANSTLSLQYIEEQSRILRDAFIKVEKRQMAKTEKFLEHLNSTVSYELKSYRALYEQLWQSTIIELESMKERQKTEVGEIGTRLSLMADELVWQKRMAVVQSTLLLLCLGLVLFARSGTSGSTAGMPIAQQLGNKYTTFFESPPPRSPPESGTGRRRRTFRSMWRSDSTAGLSERSDGANVSDAETEGARSPVQIRFSPPTPSTPGSHKGAPRAQVNSIVDSTPGVDRGLEPQTPEASLNDQAKRVLVLETQSGPATPNGTRDSRPSWEEVDRAIDQLKAKEKGQKSPKEASKNRERKNKKSPLRRSQSSYVGSVDGSPADNAELS
ncbi:hypothetical protein P153DRAFT_367545 [Dothidotthia symphoricarpi CBS 119687]|uniref:SUN domain-containing protein n=1 Tax=Dothidotthia symphoricarpi CBS 119687 TaxID=1392245 RepID=A0A6A6AB65_9PLEO|nr:uncharacterized protein P153DRAFT_367545 [Dothidotthia symphoricarpi CBS 119687]KAF2128395.1 hypothetical protein P153DRAFT_367545 [Dothidotthia symphoricarpi CBS 119687]